MRTALLISGGGTTAEAVIKAYKNGELKGINPVLVISSRPDARGIQKAQTLGIETEIIDPASLKSSKKFSEALLKSLQNHDIEFISQNGWLPLTPHQVVETFQGRIINQHPGPLDPGKKMDFGGKGMFGSRVMCARIAYMWAVGEDCWTEATTHYVTDDFDKGEILCSVRMDFPKFNKHIPMHTLSNDPQPLIEATSELQKKLLPVEHENVIQTLLKFEKGTPVAGHTRSKQLIPEKFYDILLQAKQLAIKLFPDG